jgi:DNA-binding response OmpR family regulator
MVRPTILIADHNPPIAEVLRLILQRDGYEIRVEPSSARAIRSAGEFRPQLLIIDPVMPEITGVEAAKRISDQTRCKVLFLTTAAREDWFCRTLRQLREQGYDCESLSKPFEAEEMLSHVRRCLGTANHQDAHAGSKPKWELVHAVQTASAKGRETDNRMLAKAMERKAWLRWILVLPAAAAAAVATQILVILSCRSANAGDLLTQLVGALMCPAVFVLAGARTAPAHRHVASISLTIVIAIYSTAVASWAIIERLETRWGLAWMIICGVAGIVGGIGVSYAFHEEEKREASVRFAPVIPPLD